MKVLLLTPPFTQINTPYPATAFLKQFLVSKKIQVKQADLGIELLLSIFSSEGLKAAFKQVSSKKGKLTKKSQITLQQAEKYISTVGVVIDFLQTRETSKAYAICRQDFLPWAERFNQPMDLEWTFGQQGIIDKACFFCTLYLEELFDFIRTELVQEFGFSRYAEKIALSATDFQPIHEKLQNEETFFDPILKSVLLNHLSKYKAKLVAITIPFPGCLYGALQCGKIIKEYNSSIKVALGGGYVSTELRDLNEVKIFDYADFVILDQGEVPLLQIIKYLSENQNPELLSRTYIKQNNQVTYLEGNIQDAPFSETGYPDYSDLDLTGYLSIIECPNPMHRLWNDGRWNKILVARGCYWHKCAFCDVTLDYIKNYSTISAEIIVDRMEEVISQTGQTGFHFVDEAAPPAVLKKIALELLKRKMNITWWSNIRYEKNFSLDLCKLLAKSGCIAVSGGLEAVTDRLLNLMNKGISISQAVQVLQNFAQVGILVHAYLMYGFPTQSAQETIDSLEIVRQLFENKLLQSCYWHRFSLTAHSFIANQPDLFQISITGPEKGNFAWNDLEHHDPNDCCHEKFGDGLEKAVYNFMYEIGIGFDLKEWFEIDIPKTTLSPDFIGLLAKNKNHDTVNKKQLIWLGEQPELIPGKGKKSKIRLVSSNNMGVLNRKVDPKLGNWLCNILSSISISSNKRLTMDQLSDNYEQHTGNSFQDLYEGELWASLRQFGLIAV